MPHVDEMRALAPLGAQLGVDLVHFAVAQPVRLRAGGGQGGMSVGWGVRVGLRVRRSEERL